MPTRASHASSYSYLASTRASGRIVTAWDQSFLNLITTYHTHHSLTSTFQSTATDLEFFITNCYGPYHHADKQAFLDDLIMLQSSRSGAWTLLGDFSLTRSPDDRSNDNFDHQEADWFNGALEAMAFQELPMLVRRFTWSNHQEDPILVRLGRFFVNIDWSLSIPNSTIPATSATISDHCQLMLMAVMTIPKPTVFLFNNH